MYRRSGIYHAANRNNFNGGLSYVLQWRDAAKLTNQLLKKYCHQPMPCMLVGHSVQFDIERLDRIGVVMPHDVQVLDIHTMYSQTHRDRDSSLKNALRDIGQPYASLHNSGNDAYYTLLLAMRLCDPQVRRMTKFDSGITYRGILINDNLD